MKPKNLIVLLLVTAAVVFAALNSLSDSDTKRANAEAGDGPFLTGLLDQINEVARIEVLMGDQELIAVRRNEDWTLESSGGYPAKFEVVKAILVSLANLKKVEGKTSNPENYGVLGVAAPQPGANSSTQITLKSSSDAVLGAVILGNKKGSRAPQLYVRAPDGQQAWLVDGQVNVQADPGFWMNKQFVNIAQDRIANVSIERAEDQPLFIYKERPLDSNFSVTDVPADSELISESIANSVPMGLGFLSFDEVRPASEVDFATGQVAQATYRAWDGLVIVVETVAQDGASWIRLKASSGALPEILPVPTAEGEEPTVPAPFAGLTTEELAAEIETLNASLQDWAYRVPTYKLSNFEKRMSELLREPVAVEDPAPAAAQAGIDPFSIETAEDEAPMSFEEMMNASEEDLEEPESSDG